MKHIKVEIQVTLLTVIIAAAMIGSGYLVYNSLSRIVDSIHRETRPDYKLLLVKDITAELSEIEYNVRLYSLTGDPDFVASYNQWKTSVQGKLDNLKDYEIAGSEEAQLIDSIRQLTGDKLMIWEKIRSLHRQKDNSQSSFTELYSKIDTAFVPVDTIQVKPVRPEEKKGLLKRIFGKKKEVPPPPPIIVDHSEQKANIKQEIESLEKRMSDQTRKFQVQEKALLEQHINVTSKLMKLVSKLEYGEQRKLLQKTQEADFMAAQTYRRLTVFTIAAVILLLAVLIIFIRNINRNRHYQQMLRQAKTEAENLARAKEMVVATVSHEMRTPINAIFGLTEQLIRKTNDKDMATDLRVVHQSAKHLISLVNDTLDLSKIEAQKLKIEQTDFLPEEVFREVYILNKDVAASKGIKLSVEDKALSGLTLKGDPIRLKQILINLVSNAIKFTPQGLVKVNSSFREEDDRIWLTAEVTDTGIGIQAEDKEKIFDEFVQLDNDQKQRGAGLGLSIVKKLVEIQAGKIIVDSIPGKGTLFTVSIPYLHGNFSNVARDQEKQLQLPGHLKNLHFLIVDDEEFNLYLLKNIFSKWGVRHTEAMNGKMAVELASVRNFDLIFMDVRMPVMNGFEASREILKVRPDARIVALTAVNNQEDIRKSRESGMQGFLQKPFTEAQLLELVTGFFPEKEAAPDARAPGPAMPVNPEELEKLAGNDKAFFNEMIRIFIKSGENALNTMQQSFQAKNWSAIGEAAHKLSAPAKHLAALSLYNKLKILEKEAPSGNDQPEIKQLIEQITDEFRQIKAILEEKMEESGKR